MSLRPMLGDIELQQVQFIDSDQDQVLVRHAVPALEGDFWQGLGRRAGGFSLAGVLTGAEAGEGLTSLRERFRAAAPVSFVADIAAANRVDQVLIEEMEVREIAGRPLRFEYAFRLREYLPPPPPQQEIPPPPPPPPPPADTGILEVEVLVEGQPEFDHTNTTVTVEGEQDDGSALSRTLTNRTDNVWREEDFPPGSYTCRAVVTGPPALSGSVEGTVRAGETTRVTIVLRPGQVIATRFMIHHRFDKAFVEPCMRAVLRQVAEYAANHPGEKLVIVGHTDESGSVEYNQSLSERRARASFAFLTFGRDRAAALAEWDELRRRRPSGVARAVRDTWGTREYQYILQDLGFYSGNVNGTHDGATDQAVRTFQGEHGLGVDGDVGDETWPVLIEEYLSQANLAVAEDRFLPNTSNGCDSGILKWLGCSERMPVNSTPRGQCGEPAWRPNRRTEFLFVRAEELPCTVPEPRTWALPGPGAPPRWCLGPGSSDTPCCFITRDPAETDKWLVQPSEPETVTVRGSLRRADGTPLANARFVLIDPDGEFLTGENVCRAPKGEGVPGRTDANGAFAFTDRPRRVGVYTLEILEPVMARPADDPGVEAKGNVVCKRLDGTSDFDVLICDGPASDFTLQVEGATEVGGAGSGVFVATVAAGEEVLITAVTPPGTCAAPRSIVWTGGEEVPEHGLQRRVGRDAIARETVTANMAAAGVTRSVEIFVVRLTLDLDADRDGTVEDGATGKDVWEFGAGRKGAVILVNSDNDDLAAGNSQIDRDNLVVDSAADVPDLGTLVVRQSGALPAGVTLVLATPQRNQVRVFDARAAAGTAILGPAPLSGEATIGGSAAADVELGIEALRYPDSGFDGLVNLRLLLREGATELARDEAVVRVAPWIIPSHLAVTEEIYVIEFPGQNDAFVNGVEAAATAAGVPLVRATGIPDQWVQDCMEIGIAQAPPARGFNVALNAVNPRPLDTFAPGILLGPDYGLHQPPVNADFNTFDSHGNMEASPPVTVGGREFKLGRIYFGRGRPGERVNSDVEDFLRAQRVQSPVTLDTDWLGVGHVDEVMSFVPAQTGSPFRVLFASVNEALRILQALRSAGRGGLALFAGKTEVPFQERTVAEILDDSGLMQFNADAQANLDSMESDIRTLLGVAAADIVRIPSLFVEEPLFPGVASALIPGMVNLLVITRPTFARHQLVMPDPFGPVVGGVDQLQQDVRQKLIPLGYTAGQIRFIDDYDVYHAQLGEVHCGTNQKRRAPATPWWEQTDF